MNKHTSSSIALVDKHEVARMLAGAPASGPCRDCPSIALSWYFRGQECCLRFHDRAHAEDLGSTQSLISITHTRELAMAQVILT